MQSIKNIFGRIWAVWGALAFVSTMIVFLIPFFAFCYFQKEPIKTNRFILYSRIWMDIFLFLVGCPLKIKGRENFLKGQTYIVVSNHNALIDVPVSSPGIPGGNKTIAKAEMARIPVFGLIYQTGSILVDRKNEKSRRDSFVKMREVLDMGLHMCIYPEGTRNTTAEPLKPFHDGAFRLALSSGKSIIPMIIFNSRKANPPTKGFFLLPVKLYMDFLPEIKIIPGETVELLKSRVHETMKRYILQHSPS
ncbi:MAG: lysophospholipid acyltransferase family protein [Bacteroidota bacterium]|nr:lysophospholipid acyltransferase family protein [Bacteroidota bacterium]MDP4211101.1 lysophospholipid acyltransferase family protein [Bacteroidota bacterium]MDP4249164.1 lysophospholipid acyltransferase family protein [Bacteroidota bacterium]